MRKVTAVALVLGLSLIGLSGLFTDDDPATAAQAGDAVAATEAEALELARDRGERVEIEASRGEAHEVYANPDGTRTRVQHFQPVRTLREGKWVPTDATLVRRDDGSIAPKAAAVGMVFSGGGQDAPMARMNRAGRSLALRWPGELPEPTLDGDTATYADVLPGVDLQIHAEVDGFSHQLVVKSAQAARNEKLSEIVFGLYAEGVDVRRTDSGGIRAADARVGGPVFEAPRPLMWDSGQTSAAASAESGRAGPPRDARKGPKESSRRAEVETEIGADRLTLRPDSGLLRGSDTNFPVVIDPVWRTSSLTGWGQVSSAYPNNTYWLFGSYDYGGVGRCNWPGCGTSHIRRSFFRIYTKPYAGSDIIDATLTAKQVWSAHNCTPEPVELWRTRFYGSGRTWNHQPNWVAKLDTRHTAKGGTSNCPAGPVEFNATGALQKAANGSWKNLSFGLRAKNESNRYQWKKFDNNGTYVSVRYNNPPAQPKQSELSMDPGGECVYGSDRPYVDEKPRIHAIIRDPDNGSGNAEQVRAQFRVWWYDANGDPVRHHHTTSYKRAGSIFSYGVDIDLPEGKVLAWQVRGQDGGGAWSQWSTIGPQTRCQFVYDTTAPAEPSVSSSDYPDDGSWHDGVGVYGAFTFESPSSDVEKYRYGINNNPSPANEVSADSLGGPATMEWMPKRSGPQWITVRSVDQAGQVSTTATYYVNISAGRDPVGHWKLDEGAGATEAADSAGGHPATPGSGVTFGVAGPGGSGDGAVSLDGTADGGYLATDGPVVDTTQSFSVAAWVRLEETNDKHHNAVSQEGEYQSGFQLGYDKKTGHWAMKRPTNDVDGGAGPWYKVTSGSSAPLDTWAHLVGVYDGTASELKLYVNGQLADTQEGVRGFDAKGPFEVGRSIFNGNDKNPFPGDIGDVRAFDRVVVAEEANALFRLPPQRVGYWQLNESSANQLPPAIAHWNLNEEAGATEAADSVSDHPAAAGSGVTFGVSGPRDSGDQAVNLDGTDGGYLATDGPVVDTTQSFSVAAWVRLEAADKHYNALSQSGEHQSGFQLGYGVAADRWVMKRPSLDEANDGGEWYGAFSGDPPQLNTWTHLVGVYDANTSELRLYVNGQLADTQGGVSGFDARGAFQIGRSLHNSTYRNHFPGDIADARSFDHALTEGDAAGLHNFGQPTSPEYGGSGNVLSLAGDSEVFTSSPLESALVGEGHLTLDGAGDYASTEQPVATTDESFTVTARARLTTATPGSSMTVVSQAGSTQSGFQVRYSQPDQRWQVEMAQDDASGASSTAVINDVVPTAGEAGQHLALIYDDFREELRLYVNGTLADAVATHRSDWNAGSGLQLGRALVDGSWSEHFAGAVDDVRVYAGVADQELIQQLAVRQEQPDL